MFHFSLHSSKDYLPNYHITQFNVKDHIIYLLLRKAETLHLFYKKYVNEVTKTKINKLIMVDFDH